MYFIQLRGIFKNETTNEMLHRQFSRRPNEYYNPFDKGYINNMNEFFFGWNRKVQWDSLFSLDMENVVLGE